MDQRSLGNDTKAPLEALPYPWQIPVISIYSVTAFISLGSNLITIIILLRGEHLSTVLWKFLLNLSAADILMAVFCIPFTYTNYMYGQWILFHPLCPIVQFVQVTSVTVSIYSLAVIGLDRYFAIIYPFRPVHCLKQNKFALIILIWALGCCVGSPSLFFVEVYPFTYQNATYYACDETFTEAESRLYTVFIFLLTFLIPIVGITFVYSRICIHLISNSAAPGNPDQNRDRVIVDKKIKVIKMLVTIVVMFFICWFPIHMFQLLVHFYPGFNDQKTSHGYYLYVGSYFAVHWLSMAHCLVNPFVYCFMSDNFRVGSNGLWISCAKFALLATRRRSYSKSD